jgi:uncharacterized protein YbcI
MPTSENNPTNQASAGEETLVGPRRERRKSSRSIVPTDRRSCELKVGRKRFSASLVNESQGGFAVWMNRRESLKIGKKIRLHTDKGRFTVRVIYVIEVAKSQIATPEGASRFQLGFNKASGLFCFLDTETLLQRDCRTTFQPETAKPARLKTKAEIEAAIADEINRFELDYMGQEPKHIYVCLLADILVVRLRSVLAEAKEQLAKLLPAEKGQGELKDVRSELIKTISPALEEMIEKITGAKVATTQHDINATTGEEVFVFTLARTPDILK